MAMVEYEYIGGPNDLNWKKGERHLMDTDFPIPTGWVPVQTVGQAASMNDIIVDPTVINLITENKWLVEPTETPEEVKKTKADAIWEALTGCAKGA